MRNFAAERSIHLLKTKVQEREMDMNKEKKVNVVGLEEFNKLYPGNSEVTMHPLPEGHVAKLATFHIVKR